jgi:GNAT superfamily N-acetyltransferase
MNLTIRKATEKDFPAILDLVKGLAIFQNSLERVTNTVEQMHDEKDLFKSFVAENENKEIVGIASYSFIYYTWVGKSLYLDDLYVKESYRGQKIGSELLKKIFEVAKTENCKRVRWQVSDWNTNAIQFYKKIGAEIDEECCNCDFNLKEIPSFTL